MSHERPQLGRKRSREMEAGSGGGDELDAVTLDFLFELDAWLLDEGGSEPVGGQALPLSSIPNEPLVNAPLTLEPPHSQPCSLSSIFTAPVAPPEAQTTSGESTPSPTGAQPPRKKPKSSTQRQKEELAFLRAKVKDLEDQRRQLQSRQEGREKRQEEEAATGISNNRDGILMWKSVAERQQQVKEKSEAENERLRMMVDGQIKLVESMERILHKQQVWDQLQQPRWRKGGNLVKQEANVFAELSSSVDVRYPLLASMFQAHGLNSSTPEGGGAEIKSTSADGIFIEFKHAKVFPFEFHTVDEVVWNSVRQGKIQVHATPAEVVKESEHVVMKRLTAIRPQISPNTITMCTVCKRYPFGDRTDLVWESCVTIDGSIKSSLPPLNIVLQGWGRFFPTTLSNGSPATMMQAFSTSILTILEVEDTASQPPTEEKQHIEIDILTRLILSSCLERQETAQQIMENLLLDEALSKTAQT